MTTLTLVLTAVGSVLLLLFFSHEGAYARFPGFNGGVYGGLAFFSGMPLDKIAATMEKRDGRHPRLPRRWLSPRELCLARSYMKPAQSIRLPSKCSNPSATAARIMPLALRGLVCALPLFFEVAIVLLISVAFSMARHTGTNPVKLVIPLFAGVAAAAAFPGAGGQRQCCWHRR